ncbi:hypothetical protein [Luteitalea sp.]|jgi:hypothetical protein|uniref:hypothetical protein n=1 Tax=Luteitalea sp. TaxID=2004800 RepID=UPI0037C85F4D
MSSASPTPDVAGALDRLESLLSSSAPDVPRDVGDPDVARWLCLVPAWSPALAQRCGFPGWQPGDEPARLQAWRAEGLLDHETSPLTIDETGRFTPPQELFWMPRQERQRWLTRLLAEDGRERLRTLAVDLATRILGQPRDHHMPSTTWRWATLAVQALQPVWMLEDAFVPELQQALAANRPDEAWLWIEALQRVAEVAPGDATTLQQRAVRQLALFDRTRTDRAVLRDYLPRPALFEAYRTLLTGPDSDWALHYLGGGGVGKTMLMRALTSGTAEHLPPGIDLPPTVTARIDFDHIDPDYPARRPGLLFAHLAEELRLKDEALRASEGFELLFRKIGLLHERPESERTTDDEIDDMLQVFAWACGELSQSRGARVVLLLDTCEELARLGPGGRLPDSVERTFDLLTRLHDRLPSIRVVLCGRRALAGTYAGGVGVSPDLPARPWLALHRVFAFSEEEAGAYLSRVGVPAALVDPILTRSGAAASSATLGLPSETVVPRYSPFSLSVYAGWVARQPALTPADILDDVVDHFVRIRILDRIHNIDVRRLLPHVALLGRFDEATLRACADLRPDVADAVLRELGSQEWIDRQAGGYYAVEHELRTRLLQYFKDTQKEELAAARARVLPVLRALLEDGGVADVPDEAVVQAVTELLPGNRDAMLATWRVLDGRIVAGAHAGWGTRVLGRLLADEQGLASPALDAGVWAAWVTTYGECVLRTQGAAAQVDLWPRAWDHAAHLTDPVVRATVRARIAAGGLAAGSAAGGTGDVDRWAMRLFNVVTATDEQALANPADLAPVVAALMASAEALDRRGDPFVPAEPMLERVANALTGLGHAPSRALVLACLGRFAARRQDADSAHRRFVEALGMIASSEDRELPPCLQWPVGLDATSWVVLEALRGLVGLEPVEDTLVRFATLPPVRSATALNRIEALRLRLAEAGHWVSSRERVELRLEQLSAPAAPSGGAAVARRFGEEKVDPSDVAVVRSMGEALVPPRAVALAMDLIDHARPAEGLRLLAELTSLATSARNTVVATAAEVARVEAVTRLRLGEHGRLSRQLSEGLRSLDIEGRERARAFIDTDGGFNPESTAQIALDNEVVTTRGDAHAVWRARRAFTPAERAQLARMGPTLLSVGGPSDGEWARACVALDLVECSELGGDVATQMAANAPPSPEDWWSRHPALPVHALRLWVRSAALGVSPGGPTTHLVRRVGVRRAALIALDEGELLALRLPSPALRLLALALTWFEDAGDAFGTWQVQAVLAMTRIRAGVPREAVDLSGLRAAHEAIALWETAGLPPWDAIVSATSLPLPESVGGTGAQLAAELSVRSSTGLERAPAEWTPWLHRLIALHHWVAGGVRPEVLFARADQVPLELRAWPVDGFGPTTTSETALALQKGRPPQTDPGTGRIVLESPRWSESAPAPAPVDPGTGAFPTLPSVGSAAPSASPGPPRSRGGALVWIGVGVVLLAALLALGALWGVSRVGNSSMADPGASLGEPLESPTRPVDTVGSDGPSLAASAPPGGGVAASGTAPAAPTVSGGRLAPAASDATVVWPGLIVAVLVGAAAASWLLIRRRRRAGDAGDAVASVSPVPVRAWQAAIALGGGEASFGRAGVLDATVTLRDEDGHTATSAHLRMRRSDAYAGLDALRQPPMGTALSTAVRVTPAVDRVDLLLPSRAAWPCWEALLWTGTLEGSRLGPPVVRHVPVSRARGFRPAEGRLRVALVADSPGEARQATYAWEASVRAERVTLAPATAEQIRSGQPVAGVGVVHVVASTVETPQGLFVEVSGHDAPQGESLESLHEARGTLFDASQLAHVFPEASCVLLQPARRASLELTPAGREACATARLFGAALAEQGVPIVVVLPPLDGELGAHMVRLLGRRVPSLAMGMPFDTFGFVLRARQMVFEHAQRLLPRDAAIELALQVVVYVA